MTGAGATASRSGGAVLLDRAIGYALGVVAAVTPELLSRPTPCGDWDLRRLLEHLNDALAALHEAADRGLVGLDPAVAGAAAGDPIEAFRDRANRLRGAWTDAVRDDRVVVVAGLPLTAGVVAGAGAVEIAVHAWDVARACGQRRPIPHDLAADLLAICPLLVPATARDPQFAARVTVPPSASPSDHLVALLGRQPAAS